MDTAASGSDRRDSREHEASLRRLVQQMPALLWWTDEELRITSSMGGAMAAFARDEDGLIGVSLYDYFQTKDPEYPPIAYHRRALAGEAVAYEFERGDRVFAANLEPLRDAGGAIRGVIGVALDITERKRTEQDLHRSVALLRATLDSTGDGILVVDSAGKILTYNRRFLEMWKVPESVVASGDHTRVLEFVLDQLKEPGRFVRRTMGLYARPTQESYEVLEFKDGRIFERFSPAQSAGMGSPGRVWSFRDVTQRIRADEESQRALALLRSTIESTADGILVVDTRGKIVRFNRKFVQMWRIPDSIVASGDDNRALAFVVDQLKDPERFLKKVRELYGHPDSQSYDWLEFKDGRVFERYSQPHRLGESIVGRVWSFRDVTDRARMEEILRRQARTFEHIFDAVVVTDLSGRIIDWNPGAERMFGRPKEAALGTSASSLYAPSNGSDPVPRVLDRARRDGRWSGELTFRRTDATEGISKIVAVPHGDEYGRTVGIILVHRDITEDQRA